jgi:hypothetical protein
MRIVELFDTIQGRSYFYRDKDLSKSIDYRTRYHDLNICVITETLHNIMYMY